MSMYKRIAIFFEDRDQVESVDVIGLDSGKLPLGDLTPWCGGWVGIALSGMLKGRDHWLQEVIAGPSLSILEFLDGG